MSDYIPIKLKQFWNSPIIQKYLREKDYRAFAVTCYLWIGPNQTDCGLNQEWIGNAAHFLNIRMMPDDEYNEFLRVVAELEDAELLSYNTDHHIIYSPKTLALNPPATYARVQRILEKDVLPLPDCPQRQAVIDWLKNYAAHAIASGNWKEIQHFEKRYTSLSDWFEKTFGESIESVPPSKKKPKTPPKKSVYADDSEPVRLSNLLAELIRKNNPTAKAPNLQDWAKDIDLMTRVDKRTPADIETIIRWCQADSFWHANILSTSKLREKYDQLWTKHKGKGVQQHGHSRADFENAGDSDKFGDT